MKRALLRAPQATLLLAVAMMPGLQARAADQTPAAATPGLPTPITPPAIYPPDTWEGRSAAVVRVLDKLDARVQTLTIPAGQDGTYKSLTIRAHSCLQHPSGLPPDSAALLTVQDTHAGLRPFDDWMFAAEPFVAVFESPVYGVQLIACDGTEVAPAAPPLLPPVPPPGLNLPPPTPAEAAPAPPGPGN